MLEQVLAAQEKHLGFEHPCVVWTMNNLANIYRSQGRDNDAETMDQRALASLLKHLGADQRTV
jgi:hypothetical protein